MRLVIQPDYDHLARWTATYIARKIELSNPAPETPFVLGLQIGRAHV